MKYPRQVNDEMNQLSVDEEISLIQKSTELKRIELSMIFKAQSGHPGGALSCTDILVCLFNKILKLDPLDASNSNSDVFILSKGHASAAYYAVLADHGYFDMSLLESFRSFNSPLQGHPKKGLIPGVSVSTGSLGMGLSIGLGMAMGMKLDKKDSKIFVLMGDGECDEGSVWEAAMAASHFKADNLVTIIDRNGIQSDGMTEDIMGLEPLAEKWRSFGWNVIEVDGTSIRDLYNGFIDASSSKNKPSVIIAYMIKGQGVAFMQHVKEFHGKPPTKAEFDLALEQLENYENMLIEHVKNRV
ncbi:MAG TPA: transketolase [Candidatus Lokiarchaeia archaeon]|nr:transketolase [Candidatus Lokiarchaeia archaeon]